MGREAGAHCGRSLGVAAQACSMPADLQFAPLPAAVDPDRAWIEEGLRRALALATMTELAALMTLLAAESDTGDSLAGWLKSLVVGEMDRRTDRPRPAPRATGEDEPTPGNADR